MNAVLIEAREGAESPGAGARGGCEQCLVCWDPNTGFCEEQQALITTEQSLQSHQRHSLLV